MKSEWISVEDGLPEPMITGGLQLVLGVIQRGLSESTEPMMGTYDVFQNLWYSNDGSIELPDKVTHWMPLPDPP